MRTECPSVRRRAVLRGREGHATAVEREEVDCSDWDRVHAAWSLRLWWAFLLCGRKSMYKKTCRKCFSASPFAVTVMSDMSILPWDNRTAAGRGDLVIDHCLYRRSRRIHDMMYIGYAT